MGSEASSYPASRPSEMLAFSTSTINALAEATTSLTTAAPVKTYLGKRVLAPFDV